MKITCTQENLNQGLSIVSHLASKNINLPVLSNILLKAEGGSLKLSATNLEIGITCDVRGKIEEEGSFTVDSKLLSDYVNLLPNERIDVELKDQNLELKCKNSETKIKGLEASEFPLIPQIDKKNPFLCNCQEFKRAVQQTIFAVSLNESRPEISGVLLSFNSIEPNKLVLAATDSYRLAEKRINLKKGSEEKFDIIVPARTLQEILRTLSAFKDTINVPEDIEIYISENQILFVYDQVELISRLVEGQYPDYKQIIPQEFKTQAVLSVEELVKAVKTTSLFSKSGIYDINLKFTPNSQAGESGTFGQLVVSASNTQAGENVSKLDANIKGQEDGIVVNYRYLLDGLTNMDSENILVEIIDSNSPCLLKPVEASKEGEEFETKSDYFYVIMPIKQ